MIAPLLCCSMFYTRALPFLLILVKKYSWPTKFALSINNICHDEKRHVGRRWETSIQVMALLKDAATQFETYFNS